MVAKRWNGGTANWVTASDWTPTGVPGSGDDITISTGNPQVNSNVGTVNSITVASNLLIYNGGGLTITTFVNNSGTFEVDDAYVGGNTGGSTVTIGGALTNSGTTYIGGRLINEPTYVSAASLSNTGTLSVVGGTAAARLVIGSSAGFGQTGVLTGSVFLEGRATLQFASGAITKIAAGASLIEGSFNGNATESISIAGATGQNSALRTLAENDGTFKLENGPAITLSGAFKNTGTLGVDSDYVGLPDGGSALTIAGTLTNTGQIGVGNVLIGAASTLNVSALSSTGTIAISGASASNSNPSLASVVVAGAAGLGALGHVTGQLSLSGNAMLEFGSGSIAQVDAGAQLSLSGMLARVTSGSAATTNTALTGLKENDGTLTLANGATVTTAAGTSFTNAGTANVDAGYYSPSGSTLTIGGNLINNGKARDSNGQLTGFAFNIGSGSNGMTTVTVLGAGGVSNTGSISLVGDGDAGTASQVTLNMANAAAGFGTAGHVTGTVTLSGDALIEFASGGITQVDAGAQLSITGAQARVALASAATTNSALTPLSRNDGTLVLAQTTIATTAGTAFTNTGTLLLDTGYAQSGSRLTFGGMLTNSGTIDVGNGAMSSAVAVTASGLINNGSLQLEGQGVPVGTTGALASLTISGPTSGTGAIGIGDSASISLGGAVSAGQTITFNDVNGTLRLGAPGSFLGTVTRFGSGDTVDLMGETVVQATYSAGVVTVTLTGGTTQTFAISGSPGVGFTSDGGGGTDLVAAISVATYEANKATLDQKGGGIAIADTAAAIVDEVPALQSETYLSALILTGGSATATGSFSIAHATELDLGNSTLTLAGSAIFPASGTASTLITGEGGTLVTQGATSLGRVTLGNVANWQNSGTITETGPLQIGDNSNQVAQLVNGTGGVFNLAGDVGIAVGPNKGSTFDNDGGTLAKTGGTGTSTVAAKIQDSGTIAAQIRVASGTLSFTGLGDTFASQAISGSGTFAIGGGSSTIGAKTTIATSSFGVTGAGTAVTLGENLSYGGTFAQGAGSVLTLTGGYLLLSAAATFTGATVNGSQRLYAEGTTAISGGLTVGGTAVFETTKVTRQSGGAVSVGDGSGSAAILFNYAGGTYAILDDSGIGHGSSASSYILNQGLFEKTSGAGTSTIAASFVDTGSVAVVTGGTLAFTGPSNSIAGALGGGGTILFGGGATLLNSGTTASAAALTVSGTGTVLSVAENLAYAGAFSTGAGTTLSIGSGDKLTETGTSSFGGTVSGPGTLAFAGGRATLASGAAFSVAGLSLAGSSTMVTLGENLSYAGAFSAGSGATLTLTGGYLLLSGATTLSGATINGSQRLYAEGTSTTIAGLTIGGTAVVETTKAVTQSGGTVTVGDTTSSAAVLYTYGGSTYSITDDSSIARGASANSYILDQGTIQKTGGTGTSTIGVNIANNVSQAGVVGVTSGTLDLGGTLSGNLALQLGASATLILDKAAAAGVAATYTGSNATLQLNDTQDYHGTIAGFAGTETLDLRSIGFGQGIATTLGYSGTTTSGTLTVSDGTRTASLTMLGSYTKQSFALGTDSHGGTAITFA